MQVQEYKTKFIPKVKASKITPKGLSVRFIISSSSKTSKNYNAAKVLAEHIDIIAESRSLITKGETITWEEMLSSNGQKAK
jgi:hypothetical protein